MSAVGRAGQHHEITVYFSGEQYSVTVKGKERILDSGKRLEIRSFRNTDGCAVKILTPDDIVGIFYLHQSGIISVNRHERACLLHLQTESYLIKIPVNCIFAASHVDIRNTVDLFPTEHADEFITVRHYGTVEDSGYSFTGFLPIIGFSLYLHTGAPVWSSGLSCQGTLGTAGLIILTLLIRVTSFLYYLSCFLF